MPDTFGSLPRPHPPDLDAHMTLARRIAASPAYAGVDADELLGEAMLAVADGLRRHEKEARRELPSYLAVCIHNRLRRLRDRETAGRCEQLDDAAERQLVDLGANPADAAAARDVWALAAVILPPRQLLVLAMLREGLSCEEIADALQIQPGTVRRAKADVIARLRKASS